MENGDLLPIYAVSAVVCGLLGLMIGSSKNMAASGFFLGVLLGPIGLIIVALASQPTPQVAPSTSVGGWWPDPYGRFDKRYYDGSTWTNHVIDAAGVQSIENLTA